MKKWLLALLSLMLVATMALSFTACGGDAKKTDADDEEEDTSVTTTVEETEPTEAPTDAPETEPTEPADEPTEPTDAPADEEGIVVMEGELDLEGVKVAYKINFLPDSTYTVEMTNVETGETATDGGTYEDFDDKVVLDGEVEMTPNDDGTFTLFDAGYELVLTVTEVK